MTQAAQFVHTYFCKHQTLVSGDVTLTFGTIIKTFNVFWVVSKFKKKKEPTNIKTIVLCNTNDNVIIKSTIHLQYDMF